MDDGCFYISIFNIKIEYFIKLIPEKKKEEEKKHRNGNGPVHDRKFKDLFM